MAKSGSGLLVRLVLLLALGAGLAAGAYYYKAGQKEALGETLFKDFMTHLDEAGLDTASRGYVDSLARRFHPQAFEGAFVSRDGATGGVVNANAYQRTLVDRIIAQAKSDGSTHIAKALEKFKADSAGGEGLDLTGNGR